MDDKLKLDKVNREKLKIDNDNANMNYHDLRQNYEQITTFIENHDALQQQNQIPIMTNIALKSLTLEENLYNASLGIIKPIKNSRAYYTSNTKYISSPSKRKKGGDDAITGWDDAELHLNHDNNSQKSPNTNKGDIEQFHNGGTLDEVMPNNINQRLPIWSPISSLPSSKNSRSMQKMIKQITMLKNLPKSLKLDQDNEVRQCIGLGNIKDSNIEIIQSLKKDPRLTIRRKSCYCNDCGGLSELEKKTMHIVISYEYKDVSFEKLLKNKIKQNKVEQPKEFLQNGKKDDNNIRNEINNENFRTNIRKSSSELMRISNKISTQRILLFGGGLRNENSMGLREHTEHEKTSPFLEMNNSNKKIGRLSVININMSKDSNDQIKNNHQSSSKTELTPNNYDIKLLEIQGSTFSEMNAKYLNKPNYTNETSELIKNKKLTFSPKMLKDDILTESDINSQKEKLNQITTNINKKSSLETQNSIRQKSCDFRLTHKKKEYSKISLSSLIKIENLLAPDSINKPNAISIKEDMLTNPNVPLQDNNIDSMKNPPNSSLAYIRKHIKRLTREINQHSKSKSLKHFDTIIIKKSDSTPRLITTSPERHCMTERINPEAINAEAKMTNQILNKKLTDKNRLSFRDKKIRSIYSSSGFHRSSNSNSNLANSLQKNEHISVLKSINPIQNRISTEENEFNKAILAPEADNKLVMLPIRKVFSSSSSISAHQKLRGTLRLKKKNEISEIDCMTSDNSHFLQFKKIQCKKRMTNLFLEKGNLDQQIYCI